MRDSRYGACQEFRPRRKKEEERRGEKAAAEEEKKKEKKEEKEEEIRSIKRSLGTLGRNLRSRGEKEMLWKDKKGIETKEPEDEGTGAPSLEENQKPVQIQTS
ncbi:hypothetical protein ACOSQ4_021380 [Xanthoceras sorbifolium]